MKKRQWLSILLSMCMVLTITPITSYADISTEGKDPSIGTLKFSDVNGHWASDAIYKWAALGVVKGDERGFRPNDTITRAEMAIILDNLMDYQKKADNKFSDVDNKAWYSDAVLKAKASGIITGDGAGHAYPTEKITREQAAVMLARSFGVDEISNSNTSFKDAGNISSWAKALVFGMEADKYLGGMSNGNFEPKSNITRAQVVTIIDNAVKAYYTTAGTFKDNVEPATSGANCLAIVKTDGVIIKDAKISGDLIVAEGVAKGNFTIDNSTITGKLIARGGGENSIHIINGAEVNGRVSVERVDGVVRIVSDGVVIANLDASTEVILEGDFTNVTVAEGAAVEVRGQVATIDVEAKAEVVISKESKIGTLTVQKDAEGSKVEISGTVGSVKTEASKTEIVATETAKITTIKATATATGTNIEIDKKAVVKTLDSDSSITTSGSGAAQSVTGTGTVSPKESNTTPATTPIGGSVGGNTAPALSSATISGAPKINATLKAAPVISGSGGTVSYQWYRSTTNGAINVASDTAIGTNSTYVLANADKDNYIYCVVSGTGSTTGGSKNTNIVGPIGDAVTPSETVSSIAFTDTDTDSGQISGTLTWAPPTDVSNIKEYIAYSSVDGDTRGSEINTVAVGTNQIVIPSNTSAVSYIIVVCKNLTGESSVDSSVAVTDISKAATPTASFEASTMILSGVSAAMSYSVNGGTSWNAISGATVNMSSVIGLGTTNGIKVRNNGGGAVLPSDIQTINITKAATPTVGKTNETVARNDGKLTGLNATTTYAVTSNEGITWTNLTTNGSGEIIGLVPASYSIKINGSGTQLASDAATVTISAYNAKSIATLQSLSGSYLDDSGSSINLDIDGFTPATTSYAVTVFDPYIDKNEHISLSANVTTGSDATITQNDGVDLADDSGTAVVIVTAQNGTSTNQYEVSFNVERRSIYVAGGYGNTFIEGFAPDSGMAISLLATDSSGDDARGVLALGTLTVKDGSETLTKDIDYTADEDADLIIPTDNYLEGCAAGVHTIDIIITTADGLNLTCSENIYILPTTATINFDQPAGGTMEVRPYIWDADSDTRILGTVITNGSSIPTGGVNDMLISFDSDKRVKSLVITERYYGAEQVYEVTDDIILNGGELSWSPFGTVTIEAELEDVPGLLPEITGIELYKSYDWDTGDYSDQVLSTTDDIYVDDTIYIKVLFSGDTSPYYTYRLNTAGGYFIGLPNYQLPLYSVNENLEGQTVQLVISGIGKYCDGTATIDFKVNPAP